MHVSLSSFPLELAANAARPPLPLLWWLGPVMALVALLFAYVLYRQMMQLSEGNERMREIAQAVREGAMAYLRRQYRVVAVVFGILFAIFLVLAFFGLQNPIVPFAFLTGGLFSGLCGFIGMKTATNASARTAFAATKSLNSALQVALRGGAVMGLVVVGFALLDITVWFLLLYNVFPILFPNNFISLAENPLPQITAIMLSFGMGASTQALFARVGGGIYTKAADVGADLVGKVEANIPEDDPRNPATIADNVGDNVGDVAGMGADLYESYAGSILATAALGVAAVGFKGAELLGGKSALEMGMIYIAVPIALAAVGVLLSILAIFVVRAREDANQAELIGALSRGLYISSAGIAVLSLPLFFLLGIPNPINLWVVVLTGLAVGIAVGKLTEYYTSHAFEPTRSIASHASTSVATAMIEGLAVGMRSGGLPVAVVVIGIVVSFYVSGGAGNILLGLYGVGLAAVSMLSTLGFTLATDAYGPIADNAGGNAEMSKLDPVVRHRTDQLDAVGNTTAAIGKGFAIGSAALTAMALLAAYLEEIRLVLHELRGVEALLVNGQMVKVTEMSIEQFMAFYGVTLLNPSVLVGVFAGVATTFYFSAMTMSAVGRAAGGMVDEVRRQFREIAGILEGKAKPDYARCVEISTAAAQREMIDPALLSIVIPVLTGIVFGVAGVLGLLAGALAAGFSMALTMSNAGGAWDNAKKYIEGGEHGGKGSEAHKAAVVGDTVGDPFKDTAGPSLNILIKLMSMVSVVFAGLIVAFSNGQGLLMMLLSR
ncbi:MAG: sodium-translocating pyrophosphatase [Anaerolineales bacterium]|nr:sodium-translocating pyrophosphatase [Anaerolineales bacterium]